MNSTRQHAVLVGAFAVTVLALAACSSSGGGHTTAGTGGGTGAGSGATSPSSSAVAPSIPNAVTLSSLEHGVDMSQCGRSSRSIKSDAGTTTITGTPTKVVALELSFADALTIVGVTPIGIADDNDKANVTGLDDGITKYTSVGLRQTPNMEAISALKPDLIVADTTRDSAILGQLSKIAPTIELKSVGASYSQVLQSDLVIAQAVNKCHQMEQALTSHLQTMHNLAGHASGANGQTFLYAVVDDTAFYAHTGDQWEPDILESLGMKSTLGAKPGARYEELTLEQVYAENPDILFLGSTADKTVVDQWKSSPIWNQLTAVKDHRVYQVNETQWSVERSLKTAQQVAQGAIKDISTQG